MENRDPEQHHQEAVVSDAQIEEHKPIVRRRWPRLKRIGQWLISIVLAFSIGLGSGYVLWGHGSAVATTETASADAPKAEATPHPNHIDLAALGKQVNPAEGYTLPAKFGNIGPKLLAAGAIDYASFVQVFQQAGRPLTDEQIAIMKEGRDAPIVIDGDNAYFLLNFLWAFGLTNRNAVLTDGRMMQGGKEAVGQFASTGGWTIGAKPATELYASTPIVTLTSEQQRRLEEVASSVYRPCCDNPTHFPDCNHGMAMLGMLELMASQDASTDEMFAAAKYINAFWFPQQTLEQAILFKAANGIDFAQVKPSQIVGVNYSSGSGFRAVHKLLADNGLLQPSNNQGGSCGVQP